MGSEAAAQHRLFHRQMYVDLIRAYLPDYGSQRDLARAIGVTEAYLSFLLEPLRTAGTKRREARWTAALPAAEHEVTAAFRFLKTPSRERARQIAGEVCTDQDRREALLYHVGRAGKPGAPGRGTTAGLPAGEAEAALIAVGEIHQTALFDPSPDASRDAYLEVWSRAEILAGAMDPGRSPVPYAQALMYQHDAAQVFNRPDLALGHARKAIMVIPESRGGGHQGGSATRMLLNALLAETVSLNTLGLNADAIAVIRQAERIPGYRHEPESWLRSFLEQRLSAMARSKRLSIYHAEKIADEAASLVASDVVLQAGISRRLLDVYTIHASARSRRAAGRLAERLRAPADSVGTLTPLRRAQILLTLYRHYRASGDLGMAASAFLEGIALTRQAGLVHQHHEWLRACRSAPR